MEGAEFELTIAHFEGQPVTFKGRSVMSATEIAKAISAGGVVNAVVVPYGKEEIELLLRPRR
jgi:hypothetical protein